MQTSLPHIPPLTYQLEPSHVNQVQILAPILSRFQGHYKRMDSNSYVWRIEITNTQEAAIRELFRQNNWEVNVVGPTSVEGSTSERDILAEVSDKEEQTMGNILRNPMPIRQLQDQLEESPVRTIDVVQEGPSNSRKIDPNNTDTDESIDKQVEDIGGCPFCFCDPCVTTYRPRWLGSGQRAKAGNNLIRKTRYKKYWKVLKDRGAWQHPSYIIKKAAAQGYGQNDYAWLPSVREIMPDCVLKIVRGLYPNPEGISYMGHRWM